MPQTREQLRSRIEHDFSYHAPSNSKQMEVYVDLRSKAKELAHLVISSTPISREQSLSITNIEQAVMWANAAVARNEFEDS